MNNNLMDEVNWPEIALRGQRAFALRRGRTFTMLLAEIDRLNKIIEDMKEERCTE